MNTTRILIQNVLTARTQYLATIAKITKEQARWKPNPEVWNLTEITEHLFWAEQGGIIMMWKTLHAIREGITKQSYDSIHKDMPIEQIIDLTWKPKEIVPAVAAPRFGGPLTFWELSLRSLQDALEEFGQDLKDEELRLQAHPHPISGPLDFQQRIEFLRFHIKRHHDQAVQLLNTMGNEGLI